VVVGKVATHLCLTLIFNELRISVGRDRVVTTLNIKFSVVGKKKTNQDPSTLFENTKTPESSLRLP
jgi:hypothetical protein